MEILSFCGMWTAAGIIMAVYYIRCRHTLRAFLRGMLTGILLLVLMHYFGGAVGFAPEINLFNIMQAGILGLPGVVLMTAAHFIL